MGRVGWEIMLLDLDIEQDHQEQQEAQRYEKISNNSSFGIIAIADDSSTSDRIIVIVITACFIHDGAYR